MELYEPNALRNIALIGHGGAGKTAVADAILWVAGAVDRLGSADKGTSVFDYEEDERQRQHSINLAVGHCIWRNTLVTIIDTPGGPDFVGDAYASLRVVDGVVLVVDATTGVEVQTERLWAKAREYGLPGIVFINKLDSDQVDYEQVLNQLRERLKVAPVPLYAPWDEGGNFKGIVSVVTEKAFTFDERGQPQEQELPAELSGMIAQRKEGLVEAAAEGNDELLEKYIEGEQLTDDEIRQGIMDAVRAGVATPIVCGAATLSAGIAFLLDAIIDYIPSPAEREPIEARIPGDGETVTVTADTQEPFAALVFKTVTDPYVGRINYFRVFSGMVHSDSQVLNANEQRRERIGQLLILQGKNVEPIGLASAGQIAAVA
ncbi:MAG TPA: GTP-binding protein, partial [Armatimonadetes bacterium]|nr:GTP-binding protein [Armatimonadota bacterium]